MDEKIKAVLDTGQESEIKLTKRQETLIENAKKQVRLAFKYSNQKSYGTRENYRDASMRFAEHAAKVWGVQNMKSIRNAHILSYVTEMLDNELKATYIKSELSGIRHMLRLMECKNNIHKTNDKFGAPRRESEALPGATLEEYRKIRTLAEKKFGKIGTLTVDLQYFFGARINETQAMRVRRIVDAARTGILHLDKTDGTKGGRPRDIRVETEEQRQVIRDALAFIKSKNKKLDDRLLTGREKGAVHRSKYRIQRMYADNVELLNDKSSHDLRRAFAQMEYDRMPGTDRERMRAVCRALGHGENRDDITARYVANRHAK